MFDFLKKLPPCPPLPSGTVRRHYRVWGRVQNVGFRYTAMWAAQELGLTGWVVNLDDGSVEMEVQGLPETIDSLFPAIEKNPHIRIDNVESRELPPDPRSRRFSVLGG